MPSVLELDATAHLDADALVVEVGSRGVGHIASLSPAIRPDVAVMTNLGLVHLETFGSIETVVDTKWELLSALPEDGIGFVNFDYDLLRNANLPCRARLFSYAVEGNADYVVSNITFTASGASFTVKGPDTFSVG